MTETLLESTDSHAAFTQNLAGDSFEVLAGVYEEPINIVTWRRRLAPNLSLAAQSVLIANSDLQISMTTSPHSVYDALLQKLGTSVETEILIRDIALLTDMFCCLLDLNEVGLRLTALRHAMCPRFHVDKVPCRLVTTYQGEGTQWLENQHVDRTKLGAGSKGLADDQSGLIKEAKIQQLQTGDVALLKGENWGGNEGFGLVHRSPPLYSGQNRLLLTFDVA